MNTYLLRLVACLFLFVSLNSFGAPITYKFYGEVKPNSSGVLFAPAGTSVEGTFTYDPNTWVLNLSSTSHDTYYSDGITEGFNLYVDNLYESLPPLPDDLNTITLTDQKWSYARRILDFSEPYYNKAIVFINILEDPQSNANFPTVIADPLTLPLTGNHNGRMIYYENNNNIIGDVSFTISSLSPVPLPAGIYLFLSGLVGLSMMRGRRSK